ncbi:MAG: hypothetical protein ACI8P0_000479 [Planctomycetaceae bacterium]|jgi:hypothetical protein
MPQIREIRDSLKQRIADLKPSSLMGKLGFGTKNEIGQTERNDIASQLSTLCDDLLMSIDEHHTDESRVARWIASRSVLSGSFRASDSGQRSRRSFDRSTPAFIGLASTNKFPRQRGSTVNEVPK